MTTPYNSHHRSMLASICHSRKQRNHFTSGEHYSLAPMIANRHIDRLIDDGLAVVGFGGWIEATEEGRTVNAEVVYVAPRVLTNGAMPNMKIEEEARYVPRSSGRPGADDHKKHTSGGFLCPGKVSAAAA